MKTKEELNVLKTEVETLKKKLAELTDEELMQISGGSDYAPCACVCCNYNSKEECTFFKSVGGHTVCKYN